MFRHLNRVAMYVLLPAFLLGALPLAAQSIKQFTVTGTIGSHTVVPVNGLVGDDKVLFNSITDNDFSNGEVVTVNGIQMSGIRSNKPVFLRIQQNAWTLPAEYDSVLGSKKADGNDSELLVKINPATLSSSAGHISPVGNFATAFQPVTNTPANFVKLGQIVSGKKYGVKDGVVDLDVKILLDPVYDVPGTYVADLELTIADQ